MAGAFSRRHPYRSASRRPARQGGAPFLAGLLAAQAGKHARQRCTCAAGHDGSGRYLFLGPDGGPHRNSNYARRIFRPACDGRHWPANGGPGRLVIADVTHGREHRPRHGRQACRESRSLRRPAGAPSG